MQPIDPVSSKIAGAAVEVGKERRETRLSGSQERYGAPERQREVCRHVVIGASAGGINALERILAALPRDFCLPIVVCQHISQSVGPDFCEAFTGMTPLRVKEADEKERPLPGHVYFSPPGYHLLVERNGEFSLSVDEKVSYARPSIDVLFESAALAWAPALLGVLLTGANADGAAGMKRIKALGGRTVVQDPADAYCPVMPEAAIALQCVDVILSLDEIASLLTDTHSEILTGPAQLEPRAP